MNIVKDASGASNDQDAVERILSDPSLAKTVDKAIEVQWFQVQEIGGGVVEARKANVELMKAAGGGLTSPAFIITCILLLPVYFAVGIVLWPGSEFSGDIKLMVVSVLVSGITGIITTYWLGTSFSSARKTDLTASQTASTPAIPPIK
jgi:hypothetical protein